MANVKVLNRRVLEGRTICDVEVDGKKDQAYEIQPLPSPVYVRVTGDKVVDQMRCDAAQLEVETFINRATDHMGDLNEDSHAL